MNIKPRLENGIPKDYLYITLHKDNFHNEYINKLKLKLKDTKIKRDDKKTIKETIKKYENWNSNNKYVHKKICTKSEINLYSNIEKVSKFTRKSSLIEFNETYVIKISPICMFKTWNNYNSRDTYDLHSFKLDEIFYDEENLMKSLDKDGLVKDYILNKFLRLCFTNEGYVAIKDAFIEYTLKNYSDKLPTFADIVQILKDKDSESSANYKAEEYKTKHYIDAYNRGFIKLHDEWWNTERTLILLLSHRMFDILKEWTDTMNDNQKSVISKFGEDYQNYEAVVKIKELMLSEMDNIHVKELYNMMNFKKTGYTLKIIEHSVWDRESFIKDVFESDNIEDVKKYIIRNYDCDLNKIMRGNIDDNWVYDIDDKETSYEMKLEFVD